MDMIVRKVQNKTDIRPKRSHSRFKIWMSIWGISQNFSECTIRIGIFWVVSFYFYDHIDAHEPKFSFLDL